LLRTPIPFPELSVSKIESVRRHQSIRVARRFSLWVTRKNSDIISRCMACQDAVAHARSPLPYHSHEVEASSLVGEKAGGRA
jgi:hypothetical protein